MKREGNSLVPADREAMSRVQSLKPNGVVMVGVRQPRNPRQHRLVWALARLVHENTDRFDSPEHVMNEIKLNTGHYDTVVYRIKDVGDVEHLAPRSIAYESMAQDDADAFIDSMLDYIAAEMMPGVDPVAMLAEAKAV